MKIMIVSDTHGRQRELAEALEREKNIDMLLHLGDVEGCDEEIRQLAGCPVEFVAGNNDFFSSLPKEREFSIGSCRVFMTHGHRYQVYMGTEGIRREGLKRGADIVMYGHTHVPYLDESQKPTVLNPGSISYPRQAGREDTYMIMEINQDGSRKIELKSL